MIRERTRALEFRKEMVARRLHCSYREVPVLSLPPYDASALPLFREMGSFGRGSRKCIRFRRPLFESDVSTI